MDAAGIFDHAGLETLEAENGDKGLALLKEKSCCVELLFTDVQMPGWTNGFALAREATRQWPWIGIVVASGEARPTPDDQPDRAIFIAKAFSSEMVHDHLCSVLPRDRQPATLRQRSGT